MFEGCAVCAEEVPKHAMLDVALFSITCVDHLSPASKHRPLCQCLPLLCSCVC
jgi:hypothetical protein